MLSQNTAKHKDMLRQIGFAARIVRPKVLEERSTLDNLAVCL
jgi:hypothetical protein